MNEDNQNNAQHEISELSGTKRGNIKGKINELETNHKNKSIKGLSRGILEFKKGLQPRTNLMRMVIYLHFLTIFLIDGSTLSTLRKTQTTRC
jgi:hypothetical protein